MYLSLDCPDTVMKPLPSWSAGCGMLPRGRDLRVRDAWNMSPVRVRDAGNMSSRFLGASNCSTMWPAAEAE